MNRENKIKIIIYLLMIISLIFIIILILTIKIQYIIILYTIALTFFMIILMEIYLKVQHNIDNLKEIMTNKPYEEFAEFFEILIDYMDKLKEDINKKLDK